MPASLDPRAPLGSGTYAAPGGLSTDSRSRSVEGASLVPSFHSPAPGAVRYLLAALTALLLLAGARTGVAQPTVAASAAPPMGKLELELLGPMDAPVPGTHAEVDGQSAELSAEGRAVLDVPAGTHTVLFRVPRAGLPAAPTTEPEWRVSVPDVPVEAGVPTTVRVGLSESGGFIRMDVSSPEPAAPPQLMQEAHAKAAEENGVGRVRGSVLAAADDSGVEDARVYVRGAPVETVTNTRGEFTLSLPAGTYQLWVIHPDFATQAITKVEVKAGGSVDAQAKLNPRAPGDEFLITAPHIEGGIASMIAARRETTAVADVIGSEQMSRAGASSAAAALLRVTGLTIVDGKYVIVRGMGERYSSLLVNRLQVPSPDPARRVVPLDLFPAGILESVTVQKSYSPDMPGEFGGGVVQVTTKSYPEKFTLNTSLATGGNFKSVFLNRRTSEGGAWDWAGVDDGTRALPDSFDDERGKLRLAGVRGGGYTRDEIEAFGRALPNNYATHKQRTPLDIIASVSVGDKFKLRFADIGYVAAVGYKNEYLTIRDMILRRPSATSDSGATTLLTDNRLDRYNRQVSLNAFFDWGVEFSKAHKLKFTTMLLRQTDDDTYYRTGVDSDANNTRFTRLNWIERQVASQQVGGTHRFAKLADFQADWRYAYAHARRSEPDRRDYNYQDNGPDRTYQMAQNGNERLYANGTDQSHEAQIDLIKPLDLWSSLKGKVKVGGLVYDRSRGSRVRRFSYNVYDRNFTSPRNLPIEQVLSPDGQAPLVFQETTYSNDSYDAAMRIYAGYAMAELPVHKKVDLMAGARVEQAVITVDTFDQFNPGEPTRAKLDNLDVLPAATLTYRFIKDFQARAGYSRTLNRPDFRELSSSIYFDIETNAEIQGNAAIKRAQIDNLDARLEWYYTTDEVFSIGGFAKFFNDPIESVQANSSGGNYLFTFANADSAVSYGLELEGRKRFDFISKKLDALFLASNLTLITSEVEVSRTGGGGSRTRPMASQSPYVLNIQLGWDDSAEGGSGTAVSLLYNVFGKRLRTVGADNLGLADIYEQPFHSLDFVASQTLKHGFKLGLRVRNIANSRIRWTQGDVDVRSFRRGADGQVNLSWSY
jgi:outer membrane receptor protein involved in Fe transport